MLRACDRVVERRAVRDRGPQRLDRGVARDLAAAVAAHAVGDREQRALVVDEERVLVVRAHEALVGGRRGRELHRCASSTVSPTCTVSPLRSFTGSVMRLPFTSVPLVEPASSTQSAPLRSKARACTCETKVSNVSATAQPPPRPMVESPSIGYVRPCSVSGVTTTRRHSRLRAGRLVLAGGGTGAGDRRRRGHRGAAAQLAGDDPHDPQEEHVEQREQAELQDREDRVGHVPVTTPGNAATLHPRRSRRRRRAGVL